MTMIKFDESKNPNAQSYWVPFLTGKITACGAPSKKRLFNWRGFGVTDVITLQRSDEMQQWLPALCEELQVKWHHYPLSIIR